MFDFDEKAQKFQKEFFQFSKVPMAIYGTGNNAKALLLHDFGFSFVGVIDKNRQDGEFCGKPIITLEQALALGVDIILVAAELYAEKIVYDRIADWCHAHGMRIFGMHAGDMEKTFGAAKLLGYENDVPVDQEILYRQMDEHDVISFDIFDTLLMRKTLIPQDVFNIVEGKAIQEGMDADNFAMYRIRAEKNLHDIFPNLDEIYEELSDIMHLSQDDAKRLKDMEMQAEMETIIVRKEVVRALEYAVGKGKAVYLISDMYLSTPFIRGLLDQNGIRGYRDIFVSTEYREAKFSGLYQVFKRKVKGNSYLHIGDNKDIDGLNAILNGLDAVVIRSSYLGMEKSSYKDVLRQAYSINERNLVGLFAARLFNDPFRQKIVVKSVYEYAYLFVAPILTTFILWVINQIKDKDFDALLFPARDGFILKQLYEYACDKMNLKEYPRGIYFYTSRKACIKAACINQKAADEICDEYVFSMEDIYRNMYEGNVPDRKNDAELFRLAGEQHASTLNYIKKLGLNENGKYGFVELVSGGSCQYFLENIFFNSLQGLYFCQTSGCVHKMPKISALYKEHYLDQTNTISDIDQIVLFESIVTSFEPTLIGYKEDGTCVFAGAERSEDDKKFLEDAQSGIKNFFSDYIKNLYIPKDMLYPSIAKTLLSYRKEEYTNIENTLISHIKIEDELLGKKFQEKKITET